MEIGIELVEQAKESEMKAVMETMKAIDPVPGVEPDADVIFEHCKKALVNHGLVEEVENGVKITTSGQIVLSLMMARQDAISEFIVTLNMDRETTIETLDSVHNKTNPEFVIDKLLDHIGSGQPGLLVNMFSFFIYRSIEVANSFYEEAEEDSAGKTIH